MTPNIAAVILCGGESRRMGRPKAWLPFGDSDVQQVVRLVALVARPIVVVAGQGLPSCRSPTSAWYAISWRAAVRCKGWRGWVLSLIRLSSRTRLLPMSRFSTAAGWTAGRVERRLRSGHPIR